MKAIDDTLRRVFLCARIPNKGRQTEAEMEMRAHAEDLLDEALKAGYSGNDAERLVIEQLGPPETIGGDFSRVYRSDRLSARIVFISGFTALSIAMIFAALSTFQWRLAQRMGFARSIVFSPPHITWEAVLSIGIVFSYLGFLLGRHVFVRRRGHKALGVGAALLAIATASFWLWAPGLDSALWAALVCAAVIWAFSTRGPGWIVPFILVTLTVTVFGAGFCASGCPMVFIFPVAVVFGASCCVFAKIADRFLIPRLQ